MAYWLAKTEPESFSYADLERLGQDRWNGVKNFAALKHMKNMELGDLVFIYHTGKEKAIVGVAEVVAKAYPDPNETDKRFIVVDVKPCYPLDRPVTLKEIKSNPLFQEWELVRQSRLSVMPVSEEHWQFIHNSAKQTATP
jgi:predicted RNA-binding protein with PUA-like domain